MDKNDSICIAAGNEAMRRVGYILLLWGQIETKIGWCIHALTDKEMLPVLDPRNIERDLSERLKRWKRAHREAVTDDEAHQRAVSNLGTRIRGAAIMRNTLCHGILGMVLSPNPPNATVGCWEWFYRERMSGRQPKQVFYDLARLQEELVRLEGFIGEIRDLCQSALKIRDARA